MAPASRVLGDEARGRSDRTCYRLLVPEQQVFEVYYDSESNIWVLSVAQD